MNPVQIIARKRDGAALSADEIGSLIDGYVRGDVPDYQMSAFAMAVYLRGMDGAETAALTERMLRSGDVLETPDVARRVDKHSTGGIGDKSSLILAPLLACCGLQVPMISGRGLGATGGTLDKLESIPGFRTDLTADEIQQIVERFGCVITGATANLVPADRKLYALRDVTATVASIPLITASIMSKKLAEGLSALVLDVKFGSGAFMKSLDQARILAQAMVDTGSRMGVKTTALLTDMNQPNGRLAGNAVEVDESLEVLAGGGPADLREVTLALAAEVLRMKGLAADRESALAMLSGHLSSGRALEKFREMVAAQGGNLDAPRLRAPGSLVPAGRDGYVTSIDTEQLGMAIVDLGGGRKKVGDAVDHSVGVEMLVRVGDKVEQGQPLVQIFARPADREWATRRIAEAIQISEEPCAPLPLIVERIASSSPSPSGRGQG
ncbi:MAG TPA: thymidine phosphorylase [Pirellulales bacterium]|nr:thymidine phosphorylase [Pirellulales bacterium]